jgi:hypothetical protein
MTKESFFSLGCMTQENTAKSSQEKMFFFFNLKMFFFSWDIFFWVGLIHPRDIFKLKKKTFSLGWVIHPRFFQLENVFFSLGWVIHPRENTQEKVRKRLGV